jgi:SOS-response transcriptional repressor LexA
MSIPGIYIRGLRQGRREEREQIARATGISVERQRLIEDAQAIPSYDERRAYARYFGFACVQDLDENWRSKTIVLSMGELAGRIPVVNLTPAGEPLDYEEQYPNSGIGYAYIDPPPGLVGPNLFAFVIIGDSMEPDYPEGSYAICRPTPADQIEDGAAVFLRFGAALDHTCTFKRCFRLDAQRVELRPINPRCRGDVVLKEQIDRMAPVVAVVPREPAPSGSGSVERRVVREDVQMSPDEGGA